MIFKVRCYVGNACNSGCNYLDYTGLMESRANHGDRGERLSAMPGKV